MGCFTHFFITKKIGKGFIHRMHVRIRKLFRGHFRFAKMRQNPIIVSFVCLYCIKKNTVTVKSNNFDFLHVLFSFRWKVESQK